MDIPKEDSVIFNTHAYVKKLIASGMPETQAEAQMEIFIHFIDTKLATKDSLELSKLALKKDIKELDNKLSTKIKELDLDFKAFELNFKKDIKLLEQSILIKLGGMLVIVISILGTMIKFF